VLVVKIFSYRYIGADEIGPLDGISLNIAREQVTTAIVGGQRKSGKTTLNETVIEISMSHLTGETKLCHS